MRRLATPGGELSLPAFLPDATRAVVKCLDAEDVERTGIRALMTNALHLAGDPGASVIEAAGGLRAFAGWRGVVATDSGGFQVYSLLRENKKFGGVSNSGFSYRRGGTGDKELITPDKAIQTQWRLGADIIFCLDQCTHPDDPPEVQRESVDRTIAWARASRAEFDRLVELSGGKRRPLLFGIVQGGSNPDLRRRCAEALLAVGFDGFGYGGWPIDDEGRLVDMVALTASLLPAATPKHALGIGSPTNVVAAHRAGYHTFDCALPTRDARRRRLIESLPAFRPGLSPGDEFWHYLYLEDDRYRRDTRPIDESCPCLLCRRYSRGYLRHLFEVKDSAGERLATIHNLTFYARLMGLLADPGEPVP